MGGDQTQADLPMVARSRCQCTKLRTAVSVIRIRLVVQQLCDLS